MTVLGTAPFLSGRNCPLCLLWDHTRTDCALASLFPQSTDTKRTTGWQRPYWVPREYCRRLTLTLAQTPQKPVASFMPAQYVASRDTLRWSARNPKERIRPRRPPHWTASSYIIYLLMLSFDFATCFEKGIILLGHFSPFRVSP